MRTAHHIIRTGPARAKGEHLVAANQPSACSSCTGTCNQGRNCPESAEVSRATLRAFFRTFGPYVIALLAPFLMAAVNRAPLTRALDVVSARATLVTPAQWVLIGLVLFLLAMMVVHALTDLCTELEELFTRYGAGKHPLDHPSQRTNEDAR